MKAVFSNCNVTSVVRAAIIGSVNLLAKVIFAILDMLPLHLVVNWQVFTIKFHVTVVYKINKN